MSDSKNRARATQSSVRGKENVAVRPRFGLQIPAILRSTTTRQPFVDPTQRKPTPMSALPPYSTHAASLMQPPHTHLLHQNQTHQWALREAATSHHAHNGFALMHRPEVAPYWWTCLQCGENAELFEEATRNRARILLSYQL